MNFLYLIVILAFFAYSIKLWFDYKKVAVQSKGYAKTRSIYILFLAFTILMGILSLSDKLLNSLLAKIGISFLDLSQLSEYKWMMFAAFIVLAIVMVVIFKKGTINKNANEKISDHLIEESKRKNKEIDVLKQQLANTFSSDERIHLSTKINLLQAELTSSEQEIKTLKEQLEKYSPDIEIVKKANDLLKQKGIDAALAYLESINFKRTLKASQQHAKALLIKAGFYSVKNQHTKADKAFLQSIQLHRSFDNTITYANYLFDQNQFPESIKQLLVLNLESETLAEHEKAAVLLNLATAYQENNQLKEAEEAYDKALGIYRALWTENPSVYLPYLASTLNNLANVYCSDNRLKKAETAYNEALGIRRSLSKENPRAHLPDVAATLNNLANLYRSDNRLKDAETTYNKASGIYRALWKENHSVYLPYVATTLNNVANVYYLDNRLEKAETAYNEALGIRRSLSKENPSAYLPDVATILNNIANLYYSDNRLKNAEIAYDEALDIYRALSKENLRAYLPDVATVLNNLANVYDADNHLKKAEKAYGEALEIRRSLSKENPNAHLPDVAITLNNLVNLYSIDDRLKEAEKVYYEALEIRRSLAKDNPNAYGIALANTLVMGVSLINQPRENLKEARAVLLKFKGIPQADKLLLTIEELEGE